MHPGTWLVIEDVREERARQNARWGEQNHPDGTSIIYKDAADWQRVVADSAVAAGTLTWRHILNEEVAEACAETDPERLREELIQVAAVSCAWIEAIDRR